MPLASECVGTLPGTVSAERSFVLLFVSCAVEYWVGTEPVSYTHLTLPTTPYV